MMSRFERSCGKLQGGLLHPSLALGCRPSPGQPALPWRPDVTTLPLSLPFLLFSLPVPGALCASRANGSERKPTPLSTQCVSPRLGKPFSSHLLSASSPSGLGVATVLQEAL
jgi:hypothetical protein